MSSGLGSIFTWLGVAALGLWFVVLLPRIARHFSFAPEFIIGAMVSLAGIDLWTPGLSSSPTGHRTFTTTAAPQNGATASVGLFKDANHLVSILFLTTLVLGVVYFLRYREHEVKNRWVVLGGFAITAGTYLSDAFSYIPQAESKLWTFPFIVLVLALLPEVSSTWLLRLFHRQFLIVVGLSLVALIIFPHWAMPGEAGTGASLGLSTFVHRLVRFQGMTDHPNTMGELTVLGTLLSLGIKNLRFRRTSAALFVFSLLLSGSHTSMFALPVCYVILWAYRHPHRQVIRVRVTNFVALLVGGAVAVSLLGGAPSPFGSFNNRTTVWAATLHTFLSNPWFGYGPTIWSYQYRQNLGLVGFSWAGMAHDQYVQALGQTGLIGATGLVLLLGSLVAVCWQARKFDGGLRLALMVAILMSMITEVPFSPAGIAFSMVGPVIIMVLALVGNNDDFGEDVLLASAELDQASSRRLFNLGVQ